MYIDVRAGCFYEFKIAQSNAEKKTWLRLYAAIWGLGF